MNDLNITIQEEPININIDWFIESSWSTITNLTDIPNRSHTNLQDIWTLSHSQIETSLNNKANLSHTHTASNITDFQASVSLNPDVVSNAANNHTHTNKALLDTYTQTNIDITDSITLKHTHTNKTILDNTTASFTTAQETKLSWIEAWAEVNNISDVNAIDLTDWWETNLHIHDDRYYTETETDNLLNWKQNSLTNNQLASIGNGIMLTNTDLNTITNWWRYWVIWAWNTNIPKLWEFALEVLSDWIRIMQIATYLDTTIYTRYYNWTSWFSWIPFSTNYSFSNFTISPIVSNTPIIVSSQYLKVWPWVLEFKCRFERSTQWAETIDFKVWMNTVNSLTWAEGLGTFQSTSATNKIWTFERNFLLSSDNYIYAFAPNLTNNITDAWVLANSLAFTNTVNWQAINWLNNSYYFIITLKSSLAAPWNWLKFYFSIFKNNI